MTTRSPAQWRLILGNTKNPAERILQDLIGYRKTAVTRADDIDNLNNAIAALRDIAKEDAMLLAAEWGCWATTSR